jgi:hypothetical protein
MNHFKNKFENHLREWWMALYVKEMAENQEMVKRIDRLYKTIKELAF